MPETRKTVAAKARPPKAKPSPRKTKPASKSKAAAKKQPAKRGPPKKQQQDVSAQPTSSQSEIRAFIQQQAEINKTILQRLQGLTDKSGFDSVDLGGGEGKNRQTRVGASIEPVNPVEASQIEVLSESGSSDEYGTDNEEQITNDLMEADYLLQPRFTNTKGKSISQRRKLEIAIKTNRPFTFLERETQRSILRESGHPEELPLILHVEGLVAMLANVCIDLKTKGMANHLLQVIRDVQVHSWSKIRKWSNEVILYKAMNRWSWADSDRITQARNSQYLVPNASVDTQDTMPCYKFNKGECRYESDHCGLDFALIHVCAFCFAIDGATDRHPSRGCSKKRSSANYFKARDDSKDTRNDRKFKHKKHLSGGPNDDKAKN